MDDFIENDFLAETRIMLAMYRPEGGEFLFDAAQIKSRLKAMLKALSD